MKYYVSVFLGAMSYGILSTIVVLAYGEGYHLGEVVGSQMFMGFVLSWLLAFFIKMKERYCRRKGALSTSCGSAKALTWKNRLLLMLAGTATVATSLVYYQSLRYNSASLAVVLLFQFTWMTTLIQAVSRRQRPNRVMILTLLILLGGTVFAAGLLEQGSTHLSMPGIVLGLLSAVTYTLFVLFNGKAVPDAHPAYRSAWMITGAFTVLCIVFPPRFLFQGFFGGKLMLFGFLLGTFGAFIPPLLYAVGVPHIGESMAGILGAVELPVAVFMSSTVLHEQVSFVRWAGVALILFGVMFPKLHTLKQNRDTSQLKTKAHKSV